MSKRICFKLITSAISLAFAACVGASPLEFSTSGHFSSTVSASQLTAPGAAWSLSFALNSQPMTINAGTDGFDAPFSQFSYDLAGLPVAATPSSIRFYGSSNGGLFTVFFGPESGHDSSGMFIPEFVFSGPQLYSGTTQNPALSAGSYAVSEILYTDNTNYDDQLNPASAISVANAGLATPEPASLALFSAMLMVFACALLMKRLKTS